MRLVIVCFIAAIMLVTVAVARSSSHKGGGGGGGEATRRHHHHRQPTTTTTAAAAAIVDDDVNLSSSSSRHQHQHRSWNNISTFLLSDDGDVVTLPPAVLGVKKKKSSSSSSSSSSSGKNSPSKEWGKKHKRKMASLLSMAEQDRRLSPLRLPSPPEEQSQQIGIECCPTVVEMVQPNGGTNMEGHVVELYRHGDLDQRIYEHSCRPDVLNQPCRFIEKLLRPVSRCVQQFSYTYAIVTDHPSGNDWRLDYIRIRSGCSCEIQPPPP